MSELVTFNPTKAMMRAKAKFWAAVDSNPMISDVDGLPMSEVARLAGTKSVATWASGSEEFKAWFRDRADIKARISFGAELAIDKLIEILGTPADAGRDAIVTTKDQLAAAKELLAYSGHRPADKSEHKVTADQLPNDEKELREYIQKQASKLKLIDSQPTARKLEN